MEPNLRPKNVPTFHCDVFRQFPKFSFYFAFFFFFRFNIFNWFVQEIANNKPTGATKVYKSIIKHAATTFERLLYFFF